MVEPLFRIEHSELPAAGSSISLGGAEGKHAASVRRMRIGEAIQLTNGAGSRIRGVVEAVNGSNLTVKVQSAVTESKPQLQLTLVQALAKGDRDELAIQAATELGAMCIIPWEADRSVSRWIGLKESKGVDRWLTIVTEAAKQSLRVWFPLVSSPVNTSQLEKTVGDFDLVLVLDPTANLGLSSVQLPKSGSLALVVGPEGGISEAELEKLEAAGAKRVHLGAPILRTSTAGVAAISGILGMTGQWQ